MNQGDSSGNVRLERQVRREYKTPEDPGSVAPDEAGPSLLRGDTSIHPPRLSSEEREKRRAHFTPAEQVLGIDA